VLGQSWSVSAIIAVSGPGSVFVNEFGGALKAWLGSSRS
jgi:hypothetical protein